MSSSGSDSKRGSGKDGKGAVSGLKQEWKGFRSKFNKPRWGGDSADRSASDDAEDQAELAMFLEAIAAEPAFGLERRASQNLGRALRRPVAAEAG